VLGDLVTLTTRHLKRGDRIRLTGLGILQVRKRAARMGRNPATGEAIKIKASKKVAFRVAKELKEGCSSTECPTIGDDQATSARFAVGWRQSSSSNPGATSTVRVSSHP
jgi:nucleoid DNA-binding protein